MDRLDGSNCPLQSFGGEGSLKSGVGDSLATRASRKGLKPACRPQLPRGPLSETINRLRMEKERILEEWLPSAAWQSTQARAFFRLGMPERNGSWSVYVSLADG